MSEERIEYLLNQTYYNYLYTDEAQELIDYVKQIQQENQQLKRNCNIGYEELNFYRGEYKKIKPVLDEIRECIEKDYSFAKRHDIPLMSKAEQLAGKLFEILDKVKE